jgi:hypothetical protein
MTHKTERTSVIACIIIILIIYLGILSIWLQAALAGHSSNSLYYDGLSRAFLNGQLNMLESPSPSLLRLSDPYDPFQNRLSSLDVSLYNGKYYLYWGPVPALFITLIHLFSPRPISDGFLVWFFISGLLIFNISILLWMKHKIFDDLPGWFTILGILLMGLSNPIPWLLGRPVIYEAAIAGGQFFLMSGIYWMITGLEKPIPDIHRLFLAGLSWALTIGTRMNLLFVVSFLVLFCIWFIYLKKRNLTSHQSFPTVLATPVAPLAIMLGLLGLYNYFRFGSFFEFGLQYAMSGFNIHWLYGHNLVTSIGYIIPALFNYILFPFGSLSKSYPYITLLSATNPVYHGPVFSFEYTIGIMWSLPFVVFSCIPGILTMIHAVRYWSSSNGSIINKLRGLTIAGKSVQTWIPFLFSGMALFGFLPLLVYFFVSIRFQADFTSALILLSIYGFETAFKALSDRPQLRLMLVVSAVLLGAFSIVVGVYLGINSTLLQYCLYQQAPACNY